MDSLLSDIPSMIRAMHIEEARGLLQVYLVSIFEKQTVLQQKFQELTSERDSLIARQVSGEVIEYIDVLIDSLNSEILKVHEALNLHETEFLRCVPQLGHIIVNITGWSYYDSVYRFKEDFVAAARGMARRVENLYVVDINGFIATYATVRGDGACFFRSFLTVLAYQEAGIVLPNDPEGIHEWIIRLKLLMCSHIQEIVKHNPHFEVNLQTIPHNGDVRSLQDYFSMFIRYDYQGTNYDCKILAVIFGKPIHVIRSRPSENEICQTFPPGRAEVHAIAEDHINILHQPGHYVAIVNIILCELHPAVPPEY